MHRTATHESIDHNSTRIVAGLTALFTFPLQFLDQSGQIALLLLVFLDVLPRAFSHPRWSPFTDLARTLLKGVSASPVPADPQAKRFAARVNLTLITTLVFTVSFDARLETLVLSQLVVLLACVEAAIGYCPACRLWHAMHPGDKGRHVHSH